MEAEPQTGTDACGRDDGLGLDVAIDNCIIKEQETGEAQNSGEIEGRGRLGASLFLLPLLLFSMTGFGSKFVKNFENPGNVGKEEYDGVPLSPY